MARLLRQVAHADDAGRLAAREIANEVRPPVAVADNANSDHLNAPYHSNKWKHLKSAEFRLDRGARWDQPR